ncbi:MAG: PmoA family protein [Thermoguttaceae bacterium]|nr:PmoA family protein [Thermoguttaceae bacterium]MDW8078883.1 DUF6807 family protein [Thermoguttaceae bacterium]
MKTYTVHPFRPFTQSFVSKKCFIATVLLLGFLAAAPSMLSRGALGEELPRLVLSANDRLVSLRQTTVPPETVSEYPLPSELLWEYQRAPNPRKAYVRYWTTPRGLNILRDAPADHLHHHGLMFAIGVNDIEFWAEDPKSGFQRDGGLIRSATHVEAKAGEAPRRTATVSHHLNWLGPDGQKLFLREVRELQWVDGKTQADGRPFRMILWKSRLSPPESAKAVRLWGRPYFGLGVRFIEAMDKTGEFINANGQRGVEGTNGSRALWCAYQVTAGNHPVTVAMLDWPGNPRHPATWFTMVNPFAYMSATLALHQEPLELQEGEDLVLLYGVAVWDEIVPPELITRFFDEEFKPAAESLMSEARKSN